MISGGAPSTAPPPGTGSPSKAPAIVVTIASKGEIFVGAKRIADEELERSLRELAARDKDTQLVIRTDASVPHARVVFVMDHAKKAGLSRIALDADASKRAPAPAPARP
jgi:biopolymer transport protein ExbD